MKIFHTFRHASTRRQYVALINERGEREIWINFFCGTFGNDWKHDVMVVDDGGGSFFQIQLNWPKKKVVELLPNGVSLNKSRNRDGDQSSLSYQQTSPKD